MAEWYDLICDGCVKERVGKWYDHICDDCAKEHGPTWQITSSIVPFPCRYCGKETKTNYQIPTEETRAEINWLREAALEGT